MAAKNPLEAPSLSLWEQHLLNQRQQTNPSVQGSAQGSAASLPDEKIPVGPQKAQQAQPAAADGIDPSFLVESPKPIEGGPAEERRKDEEDGIIRGSRAFIKGLIEKDLKSFSDSSVIHIVHGVRLKPRTKYAVPETRTIVVGRFGPGDVLEGFRAEVLSVLPERRIPGDIQNRIATYYAFSPYGRAWNVRKEKELLEAASAWGLRVKKYTEV